MDALTGLILIAAFYVIVLFFDNFFKSCAHYPYIKFLEGTGFQIKPFHIKWKTKALNRLLIRWGNNRPRFLNLWFTLGLYASLLLLPCALYLLLYSVYLNLKNERDYSNSGITIQAVIPGVTIPFSKLGYYCVTIICCSIVHELGHALAAVSENVNLIDVGTDVFFILPVAYVNLSTEKFSTLGIKKTLKILCAGIWHNLVSTLVVYIIYRSLPLLFSLAFDVNKGVVVREVYKNSPLLGPRGLNVGDSITQINECSITNENSWYDCLTAENHKLALCIQDDLIHNLDESVPLKHLKNGELDCCDKSKPENICFEYLDSADGILEIPSHACLPGRYIIENSNIFCTAPPHDCPHNNYCFHPILVNSTSLFKIYCKNKVVIYIGLASDIYRTIQISPYIPNSYFTTSKLPDVITELAEYIIVISLGLAVLNVIPCIHMDGQHILETLSYTLLKKRIRKSSIKMIVFTVIALCTCMIMFLCCQELLNVFN